MDNIPKKNNDLLIEINNTLNEIKKRLNVIELDIIQIKSKSIVKDKPIDKSSWFFL